MVSSTDYDLWEPYGSNLIESKSDQWSPKLNLGVQLLRVCRQIYGEAAFIPHTENYFVIAGGLNARFLEAFLKQWTIEQRRAIYTAAILDLPPSLVERIPILLPGLQHLWISLSSEPYFHRGSRAWQQRDVLKKSFTCIKFPKLIGVAVKNHPWINVEGEHLEEGLEKALSHPSAV